MAPGRAAMAQNSLGPGLRANNGPEFVSHAGQVWRWTRTEAVQNRFYTAARNRFFWRCYLERATEPEPAPLLLERLFMAPVAATPKE